MMTSFFWHPDVQGHPDAVSIARWPPRTWRGLRDIGLAPPIPLMRRAKAGEFRTAGAFEREYVRLVLDQLDPAAIWQRHKNHILLCYEQPGEPCHRRTVARWLEARLGVKVREL